MNGGGLEDALRDVRPQALLGAMCAIASMTLLAGYLYVVKPSLARLQALESGESVATLETLRTETEQTHQAIASTEGLLEGLRAQLYGGPSDLPPEKVESYIVDRLDSISARHAVELVSVKPGEATRVLMFDELLYEVEVKGEFFALAAWLWELEEELRPLVVNGFDLRPVAQGPWVGMRLRLASYRPLEGVS
jgi:hypothetical protein